MGRAGIDLLRAPAFDGARAGIAQGPAVSIRSSTGDALALDPPMMFKKLGSWLWAGLSRSRAAGRASR
jgi:hypothetical protein